MGSSRRTRRGRWTSARAIRSRRRMPPESLSTRLSRRSMRLATPRKRARLRPAARAGRSVEVREDGQVLLDRQRRVQVVELGRHAALGPGDFRLLRELEAFSSSSPSSAIACPVARSRIVVDLPAPLGPRPDAGALGDVEVEPVHGGDLSVALDDAAQADGGLGAHRVSLPVARRPARPRLPAPPRRAGSARP